MNNKTKLILILILASFLLYTYNFIYKIFSPPHLEVHFIDVGQGDSTLIIADDGKTMLIDSGLDVMSDRLIGYISNLNIKKIDYLIATHADADHIGAMDKIVDYFDIGYFSMPIFQSNSIEYKELADSLSKKNIKLTPIQRKDSFTMDNLKFIVLNPAGNNSSSDTNSQSIVLKMDYGNVSMMFMGDAGIAIEDEILSAFPNIKADVLKLGHHGSSTSSSEYFVKRIAPKFAVISCGIDNKYNHPSQIVLNVIKKHNIGYFRTDKQGSIVLKVHNSKISSNIKPIY